MPSKYIDPARLKLDKAGDKKASKGIVTGNFTSKIDINTNKIRSDDGTTIAIPREVAEQLIGKEYNNFNDFRKDLWKAIGNSKYASEFNKANQKRMKEKGMAPYVKKDLVSKDGKGRSSSVYNIDHTIEVQDGGYVYDLDNMTIMAPKTHDEKTAKEKEKRKAKKCET